MGGTVANGRCAWRGTPWTSAGWLTVIAVLVGGCGTSSALKRVDRGLQHRTFVVREITAEQGTAFLSDLGLDQVSPGPEPNSLLADGTPEELEKAAIALDLVDVNERYVIQQVASAAAVRTLPSNDQIARMIDTVTIGTFAAPPERGKGARAIIDIGNGAVLAIVPARLWPDIQAVVASGGKAIRQRRAQTQQSEPDSVVAATVLSQEPEDSGPVRDEPASSDPVRAYPPVERPAGGSAGAPSQPAVASTHSETPEHRQQEPVAENGEGLPRESRPADAAVPPDQMAADARTQAKEVLGQDSLELQQDDAKVPEAARIRLQVPLDNGDDVLALSLPEKVNLVQLIDLVGEYLHLDCVYDAEKIGSQVVTLKLHSKVQSEIRVRDLYSLLETILKFKGLAMTRHEGNLVTIVPVAETLDVDPELVDPNTPSLRAGNMVVTHVFHLRHVNTSSVTNLLQTMKLGVVVSAVEENQTLFVTCYAQRMSRIAQLIEMVDKPGEPKEFRFRQLKYTVAAALAQKILGLAQELRRVPVTLSHAAKETHEPASRSIRPPKSPSEAGPAPAAGEPGVYLDVDERTNRVLMVGPRNQLAAVDGLIDALDIPEQDVRTLCVYSIKQVNAVDVMTKLTELGIIKKPMLVSKGPAKAGPPSEAAPVQETPTEEIQAVLLEGINAVLVNATREQHDRIQAVVDYIDKSPQDLRILKIYSIEHTEAADIMEKLRSLRIVEAPNELGPRLTGATPPGSPASAKLPPVEGEASPQAVALERANSLLVRGTEGQHAVVEAAIRHIDVEPRQQNIPYEIYFLENQDPEQLATVLGKLIHETITSPDDKIQKVSSRTDEQVTVIPDKNTFSLIVHANRKNQDWIASLVEKLDTRRPQVLIDVTLVEITETEAFNYDLNVITSAPDLVATSGLTGTLVPGQPPITSTDITNRLATSGRSQFADFQSNSGDLTAFYGDRHINALLRAIQAKNYGRILAKPKILVNDNEPGLIKTTDTTYVVKQSSIPVTSGAGGTQTSLIQTAVDYQSYEAGITLNITPHISQGDLLRLEIQLTRSDFRSTEDEAKPPDKTASELKTTVFVPDASTIILGGLLRLNQNKGGTKVPLLGDIPFLGGLFRSINNRDSQSKLYVFVKTEVIRPAGLVANGTEDLKALSDRNRQAFEKHERQFQKYESWPGIKSKPAEPAKVLEAR